MKIKHTMKVAMLSVLSTLGGGILFTSCEDMFTTENGLVTDDLVPKDTVYTMMGIVKNMQRIMDRTVIFGELRADLVDVGANTPSDLRAIASFDVDDNNAYNDPRDFYSVINSCNIYLANVDAKRKSTHSTDEGYGEYYFEKEIIATKCYRAWTYLELAKIYGATNIPFILNPVLTADAAEQMVADMSNRTDMTALCTFFIDDLKPYADKIEDNEYLAPDYAVSFESGQESNVKVSYRKFFIPVRLMLAELYLWRGSFTQNVADYREAVRYYHEFLTHSSGTSLRNNVLASYRASWNNTGVKEKWSKTGLQSTYNNSFRLGSTGMVAFIPMDTTVYYGNTSSIREVFSSKYSNNYYPAAFPSAHLQEISQAQDYFYVDYESATSLSDVPANSDYAPKDEPTLRTRWDDDWQSVVGDLRFKSVYSSNTMSHVDNANFSKQWSFVNKWEEHASSGGTVSTTDQKPEFIPLFRMSTVYLHMAEALNRAGFPEAAFTILKYGISNASLEEYAGSEYDDLKLITAVSSKDIDFTQWDINYFITQNQVAFKSTTSGTMSMSQHNFPQWPVHALGCGESWLDDNYTTGVDYTNPSYAVGDETLQYVLDDEGKIIPDEEGNPDLTADGTKVYNYGKWYGIFGVVGSTTDWTTAVWMGESWNIGSETFLEMYTNLMTYDEFIGYLEEKGKDLSDKTSDDLQALYDKYEGNYNVAQTIYNHNRQLHANVQADMQTSVADLILTEEALEGMFEGTRFGDLMRFSWQTGNPSFLGQTVSKRTGSSIPDGTLAGKLASESGWYIKLPRR